MGTLISEGKEHKEFDGVTYLLERGIRADVALVKAWKVILIAILSTGIGGAEFQSRGGDVREDHSR